MSREIILPERTEKDVATIRITTYETPLMSELIARRYESDSEYGRKRQKSVRCGLTH